MKKIDGEPPGDPKNQQIEIPLLKYIPATRENRYFYENGLSKIIPKLTVKVHSNLDECYYLWQKFSPNQSIFDLWDFRYAWYLGYGYKLYFYTIYEKKQPLAVLPLWFDEERKRYEWYGSYYMEDNKFFVKDENLIDLLFKIAPKPLSLDAIEIDEKYKSKNFFTKLILDEPKYIKDLKKYQSMDDLLSSLNKKNRHHLKSDYYKVLSLNPKIISGDADNENSCQELIRLNMLRFDNKSDDFSDFHKEKRKKTFINIVKNSGVYRVKFNKVYIQNYLAAIDLILTYKDTYCAPRGGNDVYRFKGIGNFMVYFDFEDAIKNQYKFFDCLQIDYNWKHRFFEEKNLYRLVA
ncbi:MAG: hypothetical protein QHH09_01640 [Microgenomates group bacterium]|nr:hypothetical protein [Microgenomates group bacterium]